MKSIKNNLQILKLRAIFLLTVTLIAEAIFTALPLNIIKAYADPFSKTITNTKLGSGDIGSPAEPATKDSPWSGSKVWYGKFKIGDNQPSPLLFRVLSPKTATYTDTAHPTMFLDCENTLYSKAFNDPPYLETVEGNLWRYSRLRYSLNGDDFLEKAEGFTDKERACIALSNLVGWCYESDSYLGDENKSFVFTHTKRTRAEVSSDKIFILDAEEALNPSYGYWKHSGYLGGSEEPISINNHVKHYINNDSSYYWWLRTQGNQEDKVVIVLQKGNLSSTTITSEGGLTYYNVSPALNIDLNSVLFSTVVTSDPGAGELNAEYKLTISDNSLSASITPGECVNKTGNMISIPYTVNGDPDHISVLITDRDYYIEGANIKAYSSY
nr:DUF6273 domain-containing protein [Lachnospiraceae bacterium]